VTRPVYSAAANTGGSDTARAIQTDWIWTNSRIPNDDNTLLVVVAAADYTVNRKADWYNSRGEGRSRSHLAETDYTRRKRQALLELCARKQPGMSRIRAFLSLA
jgi:hypothetical protein